LSIHIVSGTERTGTSMMMYALIKGGMEGIYYPPNSRKHKFNPNGLYEFTGNTLKNMLRAEGKVIKVFGKILIDIDYCFETKLKIVYMVRNPAEIFISHKTMDKHYTPDRIKKEMNNNLLLERDKKEKEIIENLPKKRKDILTLDVFDYNWVIENPSKAFTKLKQQDWNIDVNKCISTINPHYCHSKYYQDFYNRKNK